MTLQAPAAGARAEAADATIARATPAEETTDQWRPARTVAVILAGGTGVRLGLGIPKQLVKIAGKTILEHTIAAFEAAPEIDEILVMMPADHILDAQHIVAEAGFAKVTQVAEGGDTRSESTQKALDLLGSDDCNVLLHDAVRPLVSGHIIRECCTALRQFSAVDVAIPTADTIVVVGDDDCIEAVPPRAGLRRGQTPQGFRSPVIRQAYRLAAQDPTFAATDDCGVVLRYLPQVPIKVVAGSDENIKVTHPVDVHIADKLFQLSTHRRDRVDGGNDVLLRDRTLAVFGGSYGIGEEVARRAAERGAKVFAFSRSLTQTFVEQPADVAAALQQAHAATGRIDYVVLTAGQLQTGALADADDESIDSMLAVNYRAPISVARLALPYLRANHGQLLLFTSSSYTRGRAGYALYSSVKAAIVNLTQALADEWAPLRVRVNCINPERTSTPMRVRAFGDEPQHTLLPAAAVALACLDVLTSPLTGQVIDVRKLDPANT
jgi:ribitol-5-phosphate 2-dehydrogenase (NADP+) / D-ribitol-5-phosphate cytidylyltransferase